MYLTRFRVNTARSGARRLIGSPHLMHGAVNMSFPGPQPREGQGPRALWRIDRDHDADTTLYIVSPDRPDLTHLVEQAGWPTLETPGWTTFAYAEFLDALTEGDTWAFRLTANPVHNIRRAQDAPDSPTKRAAHRTPRHQMKWLLDRQEKSGFEVVRKPADLRLTEHGDAYELVVRDQVPLQFRRPPAERGRNDVRFTRVTFDGRLRVTDPAVFRRVLTHGLGKAKAYGCGLLTLAPAGPR
ncbi:type I-E CRISPR-associated protein Cas6/Cse3/CasE [Streptomyces sp. TRM 70351]|uniref:type I-E CRISPR-associated protein Cas6/Cse3/CasE n=1 Tax=Streptomyces sp. TRM 70351 TaxID=3116552 RepID=UPI002E7BC131|nr:type I-E CRISPR-associated protein Cas6/Cse3/CasE [Streptomyces sp. TRM 70351]MEE1927397.1 type I-E CRISPR-associated protein Cas6/Cse3/CasE [Streptomyces sp. TRM 70351]